MQHYTAEALWGSVWSRPGLTMRLRVLVTLSILCSLQRLPQLRTYLHSALNLGVDPGEVQEVLIQCSVFAGFPATVNAMELFRDVLEARAISVEAAAVVEVPVDELDARGSRLGLELRGEPTALMGESTALMGESTPRLGEPTAAGRAGSLPGPGADAAETLLRLERQYVFGEIFHRPGLDLPGRAAAALASAIALRLPDEQRAWAGGCLRVGVDASSVAEIVLHSAYYAGFPAARDAMRIVAEVIAAPPGP
jgi:4-carboxymuconolactone decarboxylase